jgi:hypothetical protein
MGFFVGCDDMHNSPGPILPSPSPMFRTGRALPFAVVLFAFFLAACEDPSGVGIGLIDDPADAPFVRHVQPAVTPAYRSVVTGNAPRILAGTVDDPLFGQIEAIGHLGFGAGAGVTEAFREGPTTGAVLQLAPEFRYGDTLSTVTYALHDILDQWSGSGARIDTTLATGPEILRFTMTSADTLIQLDLPSSWVAAHDTTLRSEHFTDVFPGFAIKPVDGNLIIGFNRSWSTLTVTSQAIEEAVYPGGRTLTTINQPADPAQLPIPDGRFGLQNVRGLVADVDFDVAEFTEVSLNRAVLEVREDTLSIQQATPAHFVRPTARTLELMGITEGGDLFPVQLAERTVDGTYRFSGSALRESLQRTINGNPPYVGYRLRVATGELGLLSTLLFGPDHPEHPPTLALTSTLVGR